MKIKKLIIALCLFLAAFCTFALGGCAVEPYTVRWYLSYYVTDGVAYEVGFDWYDHFNPVYPSAAQIFFEQNGTFFFKDKDGVEYGGLYSYKNNKNDTTVTLNFADGSYFTGTCSGRYRSFAEFEINGVYYNFDDRDHTFGEDYLSLFLDDVIYGLNYFAATGDYRVHYDRYLTNAVIGKVGDSFVAVTDGSMYLLDNYNFWCYDVNGDEIKVSEPKEGECILRLGYNRLAIYYMQTENPETGIE